LEHSIEVFHDLEEFWAKEHPKHPASKEYLKNKTPHNASRCWCFATQRKNQLIEKNFACHSDKAEAEREPGGIVCTKE